MSLLPFFLPSAGSSLPEALQPAELQGSLTGNWIYQAPSLFHHLYSPAFSLATGGFYTTLCLHRTASTHAGASAHLRLLQFLSSQNKLCFPLPGVCTPSRHVSRSHSPFWVFLWFARKPPSPLRWQGTSANWPGLNFLHLKLLPFEFSCWSKETNPAVKPA